MARRRSRRRKSSYKTEGEPSGLPNHLVLEDLSPRARRLVEGGLIDVNLIEGSGEEGRITSGDILHAARVMEVEQSVARIESTGDGHGQPEPESDDGLESDPSPQVPEPDPEPDSGPAPGPVSASEESGPEITDAATTSGSRVGGDPVSVPPSPWDAYNGVSEGLAESALPGAEQSWGEAEANIEAIAQEAAARAGQEAEDPVAAVDEVLVAADISGSSEEAEEPVVSEAAEAELIEPLPAESGDAPHEPIPAAEAIESKPVETVVEPGAAADEAAPSEPVEQAKPIVEQEPVAAAVEPQPHSQQERVMMDFGTLELVDPESVWAEGAEDFAPWFLAHSRQLGDVLGLEAGLSEARQFTTKSATGVVGSDDGGDEVVVVSSQNAVAEDSDLGRALGMAASSGAATVALVSAKFHEEQLAALAWLNNQTKSGVQWYGIEMKVVRIADSPAAMLFELVASPPSQD